ncbi:MAG TPA: gluconokinase [Pyrinomonadaceae bacterium]|nr:gluconokinase [Pyrinomonadaceae bacterium]
MPDEETEAVVAAGAAEPPFVLALDVGTSGVRAAFYDSRAREVCGTAARAARAFCTTADGGSEADAEESVEAVARLMDEALARAPSEVSARAASLVVSCFWHSLVGVSTAGRALTPVYGWADTRAAAQARALGREFDERETHARTGCRFHPSYWPAKLLWLREERPRLWRESARWVSFGELLTERLCGAARASVSMASGTGLFDQRALGWDAPLVAALGLRPEQLPPLARRGETLALAGEFAARWPALGGARVFPSVADGAANNVGEGCTSRSRVALMVGTSGAMRVAYEGGPPARLDPGLWCYRVDERRALTGGALSDGGGLYAWMKETLAVAGGAEELERSVAALAPDAHGLTVLPFWSGERSTGWHGSAAGALLGLRAHTRPAEIMRAALEAVAYRFARVAGALEEHAPGAEVRASGGALRASRTWTQIIADVLGRPVRLSRVREASSRGAVLLALEATGAIQNVSDLDAPPGATVEPDPARHAVYRRGLERQQKLYDLLIDNPQLV